MLSKVSLSCFIDVPGLAAARRLFAKDAGGISAARTPKIWSTD